MSHVAAQHPDLTTPPAPAPDGTVPAFANGSLIDGKYLVEETMAEGGIGVIIAARHLALDQRVAIKYLKPEARTNQAVLDRFVREGRLAAQIPSDHVVRVHDVGVHAEGGPYIVMEYLVGEDLGRVVRRGPIPVKTAVDYVLQACEALAAAHALRIVHRDVKPENLFLAERASNTPIVKVVDFGISKVAPKRDHEGRWAHETAAGERFGTPLYMSPEQLRSSSTVDPRTDVWSLGVTLHELIAGSVPFEGTDLPQLCTSVLTGTPIALTTARPDAPAMLEAVVLKCLEKDPDHRFQNLAELAQELAPFGPPESATRVGRIQDVIRRAGEIIRPPTPSPSSVEIRPSIIAASLASGAHAMITGAQAATVVSPGADATEGIDGGTEGGRRGIAWLIGGGLALAVAAVAIMGKPPARAGGFGVGRGVGVGGAPPSAAAAGTASTPTTTRTATTVAAVAARADETPTGGPSASAPQAVASASAAMQPPPASRLKVLAPKPPRAGPDQRRSLFGDRK